MKKVTPVQVKLTTTMEQDGQRESFHFNEQGEFIELNGTYYLRYQEHQDGQTTPVQFRIGEQELHLRRRGVRETNFHFVPNQTTKARYQTEYGVIGMEVTTNHLLLIVEPNQAQGSIDLKYQLVANQQLIGTYQLQLQFRH